MNPKIRKGILAVWAAALFAVVVVTVLWVVGYYIYDQVKTSMQETYGFPEEGQETLTRLDQVWQWWPLILLFGVSLWAVLWSQRREPYPYGV